MASVLVWGSSHWDTTDAEWSSPGSYQTTLYIQNSNLIEFAQITHLNSSVAITNSNFTQFSSNQGSFVNPDGADVYVSPTTARWYMRLPDMYRNDDRAFTTPLVATQTFGNYDAGDSYDSGDSYDAPSTITVGNVTTPDRPLLRYMSTLGDQIGNVENIIDRIGASPSALTDPAIADAAWLPWLGQLVAARLTLPIGDIEAARAQIATALTGIRRGSAQALVGIVQPVLSGTQQVQIIPNFGGNPWFLGVNTLSSQTPGSLTGIGLQWDNGTWDNAEWEEPDPVVSLLQNADNKPVGYQIVHTITEG